MKKSDMLPGLTAEQWAHPLQLLGKIVIALAFISGGAYFVSGATAETVPPWLYVLFAVTIAIFSVAYGLSIVMLVKASREAKAGYTTTGGMYPKVPQLHSLTGEVLREVGQALRVRQRARPKKRLK